MLNLEKHYNAARKLVGDKGPDLVHHCYLLVHDKLEGVSYPDTYFHRTMINQLSKKDSFKRKQATVHPTALMQPIESTREVASTQEPDEWSNLNTLRVEGILQSIRDEGHDEEVVVFMAKASGQSVSEISRKTGVCRETLYECIEFVKSTVIERYEHHTN